MDLNGGITEARTSMDLNKAITQACTNLNSKLEGCPKEKERSKCMIYRVHRHLRDANCTAYEPEVVSIGPYHRGKDHLKMMENHKLLNLQLLVKRLGIDIMELAAVLGGVASKARKCYADQDFELSESEFIEMLVLDGCFIIQLVQTFVRSKNEIDPIFQMRWMTRSLYRDLMLFENQVPFFVLLKLFNLIWPHSTDFDLVNLLSYFFNNLYPGSRWSFEEVCSSEVAMQSSQEIMHILDLIHRNWLPRESQSEERSKLEESRKLQNHKNQREKKLDTHTITMKNFEFMHCATVLTEANVKFKVKKAATCLFDIEFRDGTMIMPSLLIVDKTECLFRNLIAYEQYSQSPSDFVTQYMKLLDNLINSSKDVEILTQNRIIKNGQGDDEVVANMVNKLGDSIATGVPKYVQLYEDVNEHCRKPKNIWIAMPKNKLMAKLRRDYLHSPWAIISILAAAVLLLLTIVQTVFTILQVVQ